MYCYNPSCDHFERIFNKSGEIKTTLPKIDQITCIFDNQEALAEYYGIEDEVQYSCVKYYQGGPVLLRPAYNNEKWIPVAHSCVGHKLDLDSNEYNRKIFFELYDAIIERDDFSRFIVHSDETKFKFSKKLTYTLYTIIAHESITIGDGTTIGWDTLLMDSDMHRIISTETGEAYPMTRPIEIGKHCWICNRVHIMKGSIIPDDVIVASDSLVNKKMEVPSYSMIAGVPAELKKKNIKHIR